MKNDINTPKDEFDADDLTLISLAQEYSDEDKARALFQDNPLAAFEGRRLPHVPELQDELPAPRRKRFFFF